MTIHDFIQELDGIFLIKNRNFGSNVTILTRKSFTTYVIPMSVWFFVWLISMAISGFFGFLMLLAGVYIFFTYKNLCFIYG